MLMYILVALVSFLAGATSVALAAWLIERRTLARPGARVAVAHRLLKEEVRR